MVTSALEETPLFESGFNVTTETFVCHTFGKIGKAYSVGIVDVGCYISRWYALIVAKRVSQ